MAPGCSSNGSASREENTPGWKVGAQPMSMPSPGGAAGMRYVFSFRMEAPRPPAEMR